MLLSKAIGGAATEPSYFWNIFEVRSSILIWHPTHYIHSEASILTSTTPTIAMCVTKPFFFVRDIDTPF
jgi:hypothetical protein